MLLVSNLLKDVWVVKRESSVAHVDEQTHVLGIFLQSVPHAVPDRTTDC